jgi:multimeric flavodoxin WrbA
MNEIYPLWVAAHGVMIITPVNWYQVSSPLKLMMDRLVCADGGNTDPTSTHGKDAAVAKELELAGWPYDRHLKGRQFAVVVHGDAEGAEGVRRSLADWLTSMELCAAAALDTDTSVTGNPTPRITRNWIATRPCRKKSAMPRVRWWRVSKQLAAASKSPRQQI